MKSRNHFLSRALLAALVAGLQLGHPAEAAGQRSTSRASGTQPAQEGGAVTEAFAPVERQRGRALFTTCTGCHGNHAEGRPEMFAPNLTGQSAQYLLRQLHNFRSGARGRIEDPHGFAMRGRAIALPGDQGVRDVVAYIASLPPAAATRAAIAGEASQRGAELFATCASCHGARGEGSDPAMAPSLRGLSARYIVTSLEKFRNKIRGYHPSDTPGATMGVLAQSLSPSDLKAVAAYIAAQHAGAPNAERP